MNDNTNAAAYAAMREQLRAVLDRLSTLGAEPRDHGSPQSGLEEVWSGVAGAYDILGPHGIGAPTEMRTHEPDFVVEVQRTFTIKIFGTLPDYIKAGDAIEHLDSMDVGDATGMVIKATSESETGDFFTHHGPTTVIASYEDDAFAWSSPKDPTLFKHTYCEGCEATDRSLTPEGYCPECATLHPDLPKTPGITTIN